MAPKWPSRTTRKLVEALGALNLMQARNRVLDLPVTRIDARHPERFALRPIAGAPSALASPEAPDASCRPSPNAGHARDRSPWARSGDGCAGYRLFQSHLHDRPARRTRPTASRVWPAAARRPPRACDRARSWTSRRWSARSGWRSNRPSAPRMSGSPTWCWAWPVPTCAATSFAPRCRSAAGRSPSSMCATRASRRWKASSRRAGKSFIPPRLALRSTARPASRTRAACSPTP